MSDETTVQPGAKFPRVFATVAISGEFSVDEATRDIGLQPAYVLRKGVPRGSDPRRISHRDAWVLRTQETETMDGTSKLHELRHLLNGNTDTLRAFCSARGLTPYVSLIAWVPQGPWMEAPNLELDSQLVTWLADLGANFTTDYSIEPQQTPTTAVTS